MFKGLFGSRSQRHYTRGIARFNAGQLSEAIACFEAAIEAEADSTDAALARFYTAEAHARLGAHELDAGEYAVALAHFDAALREHERYPDLHLQRAIVLLSMGDGESAEQAAREALDLNADFVEAGVALVAALRLQPDSDRAQAATDRWVQRAHELGHPLAGDMESGGDLLPSLVAHRSRRRERRKMIDHAESCLRDGFWTEAAQSLEPLVAETPTYPDLRLRLAASRLGLGALDAAADHLDAALANNPTFADAHVLAGIVALHRDCLRTAREHFEAAESSGRSSIAAVYGLVLCDLRGGRLDLALGGMNRLAGEDAPPVEASVLHACLEALAGRAGTARERFEAVLAHAHDTDLRLDVLVWAGGSMEPELAHQALEGIADEERTRIAVVRAHAEYCRGEGSVERARELCEAALMDHPGDPALLADLARLCSAIGDSAGGLRCLDSLAGAGSLPPRLLALKARLLRMQGQFDEALQALDSTTPADSREAALERLFLLRSMDRGQEARALFDARAADSALFLDWRVQDPERWLHPLRPWPAGRPAVPAAD